MYRASEIKALSEAEIARKLTHVRDTFIDKPIFKGKNNYPYSLFSLTDSFPALRPELVEDMADLIVYYGHFEAADVIVSEADRGGGPLAHAVAVRTGLPYVLANWYPEAIPEGIAVQTKVGFSGRGYIFLNGLVSGQKAIVVDDLLSTGGTALALLEGIVRNSAMPLEALFVAEKVGLGGREKVSRKYNIPLTALIRFVVDGDRTKMHQ